jgi:hypothetical protein
MVICKAACCPKGILLLFVAVILKAEVSRSEDTVLAGFSRELGCSIAFDSVAESPMELRERIRSKPKSAIKCERRKLSIIFL